MSYSIIAAIGKNKELGANNNLIWYLPQDLKFFKEITTGKTIVMGRKTFESLPRMLPNRKHIVISTSNDFPKEVTVYHSIEEFLENTNFNDEELFIIGGASIYKAFIEYVSEMYLTLVDAEYADADAYFPDYEHLSWDEEVIKENEDNGIKYKHVYYRKR